MNGEQSHELYNDTYRNIEAEAGVQAAFMIGQLFQNPSLLLEVQIASKQQEIMDATAAGENAGKICALHMDLKHLKLIQIESEGVHRNAHTDTTAE